ncbi:MAG: LysE family translocator [Sphingomonadales bacterium]
MNFVRVFFVGLLVSFLGSLPLGTLNIAAMQIAIGQGIQAAMLFSLGSLLAEMIYVRLSLVAMDWVLKQKLLLRLLDWLTVLIVTALALSSFYTASQADPAPNPVLGVSLPKVMLGFLMSALNPVQIPFWFGWSAVLFSRRVLVPDRTQYYFYILGIGCGTFLGNCVFIFGGQYVAYRIENNQQMLNWIIGGVFAFTAVLQLYRILRKKDTLQQIQEKASRK